ncbi:Thioredoxin domain-containing protein 5 homolog [Sergentomyia squamirostris]
MRYFSALLLLASVLLQTVLCHEEDVHTIKLTSETFEKELKESNYFVMFFAPWCGHCKRLAPTWEQLATVLNTIEGSSVKIGKVDCTEQDSLCSNHEVTGYPTLKLFKIGESEGIKFRGTRDMTTMAAFINEQLGGGEEKEVTEEEKKPEIPEAVQGLQELTDETFGKFVASGKHFVKFYAPWCGHCQKLAPTWTDLAKALEHQKTVSISKLDCTQYRPICLDFEVKGYPSLLWIEDGKKVEKYSGGRSLEDLKAYVEKMLGDEAQPAKKDDTEKEEPTQVTLQLTGDSFEHAIEKGVTFVKFFAPWCGHCKRLAPTWEELAVKFVGNSNVKIAKVDCTLGENKELCSSQEVDGFPTLHLYKNGAKLEEYNGSRSLDALHEFVQKHDKGHDEL